MAVKGMRITPFLHDQSGKVTVAVYKAQTDHEEEVWSLEIVPVDEDMVAIGGGGIASDGNDNTSTPGPGALLTASRPTIDRDPRKFPLGRGWIVESRDHRIPQNHFLTTYVIGMKIANMKRDQLQALLFIEQSTITLRSHADVFKVLDRDDIVLIGGGFQVEPFKFNLATASFPDPELVHGWHARSQDHLQESPANLDVYVIGIPAFLPSVGHVISQRFQDRNPAAGIPAPHPHGEAPVDSGFVLTGGGAEVGKFESNNGNFLWKLQPDNQRFIAASKDHIVSDPRPIMTYAMGIKIV